jgi:hypothetical protein
MFCHLSFNVETLLCLDVFLEVTPSYAIERNKPSSIIVPVDIDLLKGAFNIAYRASGYISQVNVNLTKPIRTR